MLLKLFSVVGTLAASTNKDAEPRRAVVTQEYWDNTYQVHVSPEHYPHGKLVIPGKKKCPWNVELDVLDASEAERLFENVPFLSELQDTCREAVADVADQGYEINAAKVGGYSTCINVYSKVCKNSKTDEVLKWLQASREQEARRKKRGRVLAYGGGALTLVALNAWLKRREDGEDGEDDEEVGAQRRLRQRSGEHEE